VLSSQANRTNSPLPGWSKQVWQTEWTTFNGSFDPAWDGGNDSGMAWARDRHL
jgi:hypothetical protein